MSKEFVGIYHSPEEAEEEAWCKELCEKIKRKQREYDEAKAKEKKE
jgi:hypothetical protein